MRTPHSEPSRLWEQVCHWTGSCHKGLANPVALNAPANALGHLRLGPEGGPGMPGELSGPEPDALTA